MTGDMCFSLSLDIFLTRPKLHFTFFLGSSQTPLATKKNECWDWIAFDQRRLVGKWTHNVSVIEKPDKNVSHCVSTEIVA